MGWRSSLPEDLWRLEIPLVGNPLKTLNSYLILGPRSLLVDTGFRQEPCREAMERELEAVGVDRDRMDVFLTHLHSDHTGLAPELVRPGCRVYIGAVDGQRMLAGQSEDAWLPDGCGLRAGRVFRRGNGPALGQQSGQECRACAV